MSPFSRKHHVATLRCTICLDMIVSRDTDIQPNADGHWLNTRICQCPHDAIATGHSRPNSLTRSRSLAGLLTQSRTHKPPRCATPSSLALFLLSLCCRHTKVALPLPPHPFFHHSSLTRLSHRSRRSRSKPRTRSRLSDEQRAVLNPRQYLCRCLRQVKPRHDLCDRHS